jgi:hypothetical protein
MEHWPTRGCCDMETLAHCGLLCYGNTGPLGVVVLWKTKNLCLFYWFGNERKYFSNVTVTSAGYLVWKRDDWKSFV